MGTNVDSDEVEVERIFFTEPAPHGEHHVDEGSTIDIECEAGGSPRPTEVYWLHNGRRVNQVRINPAALKS